MAVDIFLSIKEIKGESLDKEFPEAIEVMSFTYGMSQSGSMHTSGGGGAGKANFNDISFVHYVDNASPNLMLYCANGKHFKEAVISVRKAGGDKPLTYLKITLTNVIVANVSSGGSSNDDRLLENFSLNFEQVKLEYVKQENDGSGTPGPEFAWNIAQNIAV